MNNKRRLLFVPRTRIKCICFYKYRTPRELQLRCFVYSSTILGQGAAAASRQGHWPDLARGTQQPLCQRFKKNKNNTKTTFVYRNRRPLRFRYKFLFKILIPVPPIRAGILNTPTLYKCILYSYDYLHTVSLYIYIYIVTPFLLPTFNYYY